MKFVIVAAVAAAMFGGASAMAAELKVLSAGAIEPGLKRVADAFRRASGTEVKIQFNTAPQIAKKLADSDTADILIAPPGLIDAQAKAGKVVAEGRIIVGRVGTGVPTRWHAPLRFALPTLRVRLLARTMTSAEVTPPRWGRDRARRRSR